jgi:hypothetical protein
MPAYAHEWVNCGKVRCGTCKGAAYAHGPYWYAYERQGDRVVKTYIGKKRPADAPPPGEEREWPEERREYERQRQARRERQQERARQEREREEARQRSREKEPPPRARREHEPTQHDRDLALFNLSPFYTADELRKAYKRLVLEHHPDRGGDLRKMQAVNAAHERLKRHKNGR